MKFQIELLKNISMKPLLTAVFLMLQGLLYAQETVQRTMDIQARDCSGGLGRCLEATSNNKDNQQVTASFSKVANQTITMDLDFSKLSDYAKNLFSGNEKTGVYFNQNADYLVDENLAKNLNISKEFNKIAKGKYPVTVNRNWYTVTFSLTKE